MKILIPVSVGMFFAVSFFFSLFYLLLTGLGFLFFPGLVPRILTVSFRFCKYLKYLLGSETSQVSPYISDFNYMFSVSALSFIGFFL